MTADERKGIVAPLPASYRQQDFDLANVTPEQVRTILRNVRNGRLDDQDRLFRMMLDSWSRLRKCLNEISGNVTALEMEIKPGIREGAEEPTAQASQIYEVVERALESYAPRPAYWELDGKGMIKALIDAYAKGISVVEIIWHIENGIVSPRCYAPAPAKYIAYPSDATVIDRLMIAPKGVNYDSLVDFPADKFLIAMWQQGGNHPVHAANLRSLTKFWLAAIYGLGWEMQYCQLFGIPWRHVETDGSDGAMSAAQAMLDDIGSGGTAVTGPGVKLNILEGVSGTGDSSPTSSLMDRADRACDILMLGQTLTTDVGSSGSLALGDVHASVRGDVLQSVATWVAGIMTTQLIPAIVRMNFGASVSSEDMPYCEIEIPKPKDEKSIAERVKILKEIGLPVTNKWIYNELGIPEPQEGDVIFGGDNVPAIEPLDPELTESARAEIDLRPTDDMAKAAQDALEVRRTKPASERGMTSVGIARARDISNRSELSPDTVRRMVSFFARHEVDKKGETWGDKGKGWQAWHGWGGDAGREWANAKAKQLDA